MNDPYEPANEPASGSVQPTVPNNDPADLNNDPTRHSGSESSNYYDNNTPNIPKTLTHLKTITL